MLLAVSQDALRDPFSGKALVQMGQKHSVSVLTFKIHRQFCSHVSVKIWPCCLVVNTYNLFFGLGSPLKHELHGQTFKRVKLHLNNKQTVCSSIQLHFRKKNK